MVHALKQSEDEQSESIREALGRVRPRPMSKLSKGEKFFTENVMEVKGKLLWFNKELFGKSFPVSEEDLKKLCIFVDRSRRTGELEVLRQPTHGRSSSFNLIFSDELGNVYNYINAKGIGAPEIGERASPSPLSTHGILRLSDAVDERNASNLLIKNGVETSAPIAIFRIYEVITRDGRKVSTGNLDAVLFHGPPAVYLRAFSETMRLSDAGGEDFKKFAKERGMDNEEYIEWWVGEITDNLSKMHKMGLTHNNLILHNFALDGRFVDNQSVRHSSIRGRAKRLGDIIATERAVSYISKKLLIDSETRVEEQKLFLERYFEKCPEMGQYELRDIYSYAKSRADEHPANDFYKELMQAAKEVFEIKFNEKLRISKFEVARRVLQKFDNLISEPR